MAIIVNDRDALLQSVSPRVQTVGLPSNVAIDANNVPGLAAAYDATKQVSLNPTSQVFVVAKNGTVQPAAIEITALLKSITGTPTFEVTDGVVSFTNSGSKITVYPSNLTTPTATIKVSVLFNSVTYTDTVTIGKLAEGSDGVVGLLSNESCTVAASDSGVVTGAALSTAGGIFNVFDGIISKTGDASVSYSVLSQTGCTVSIAATGVYTINSILSNTASAELRAIYTRNGASITIIKVYSVSKAIAGIVGSNAKLLFLSATSQVFQIPKTNPVNPASITLTATAQSLDTNSPYTWTTTPTMTLGGSANIKTLAYADMTADTVKIDVSRDGLTDTITIVKVREGTDGISPVSGYLTNESAVVTTDALGNGANYTGTGGNFVVYNGITDVTTISTFTVVGTPSGITASIGPTTGVYTLSNMTVDQTTVTFQASYAGNIIQKVYSISKAKAGAAGTSKAVTVSTDSQIFKIDKTGAVDRNQVTINASGQNLVGSPSFTTSPTVTLTGTGNSRVLAFTNMTADSVSVTATWDGVADTVTVVKVREGLNSITAFLTNEAVIVPADKNGVVLASSFAISGGTFKFYDGITDKTGAANVTYSVFSQTGVNVTIDAAGVYTVNSMSIDAGAATLRAVYTGVTPTVTIEKTYSIAKSRTGVDGAQGGAGPAGPRGTVSIAAATGGSSWTDAAANSALTNVGYGSPQNRDIVTLYNTSVSYSESKFYSNGSWLALDAYINGNLLVSGTVAASKITTSSLSALSANLGSITAGSIHGASIHGGLLNSYAWNPANQGANGFYLGPEGLLIGNANINRYFQVDAAGNVYAPGFTIINGSPNFAGNISGASGTFAGSLTAGEVITTGNIQNRAVSQTVAYGLYKPPNSYVDRTDYFSIGQDSVAIFGIRWISNDGQIEPGQVQAQLHGPNGLVAVIYCDYVGNGSTMMLSMAAGGYAIVTINSSTTAYGGGWCESSLVWLKR